MNHLILVKHSLPEIVAATPAKEWSLSREGQERCKALAEKVMLYSPNIVIASLEPKAIETAQLVARQIDKPFHTFEGLHEHDRTEVGFLDREQFESQVHDLFEHPDQLVFGRETACQACERFSNALMSVEAGYADKNIAVVSHGTVITLFVEKVTGMEPLSFWKKLGLPSFVVFSLPDHKLLTIVESLV